MAVSTAIGELHAAEHNSSGLDTCAAGLAFEARWEVVEAHALEPCY